MKLNYLLVFAPIAVLMDWMGANPILVFLAATAAIVPLAGLMEEATESLSTYLGPTVGGLLNATLGNAPEIIISLLGLQKGLHDVVKASLTGSIIGNVLFALGAAMIAGGMRKRFQKFDGVEAGMSAGLLMLASVGLIIPALFHHTTASETTELSLETSVVLFIVYGLSVVYTLRSGSSKEEASKPSVMPGEQAAKVDHAKWSRNKSMAILGGVTIVLAIISEVLTGALEPASQSLGLTPVFAGVIVLALVGNAAQLLSAISLARKDQMDLAFAITVGSSTQVALFVAPLLVFLSTMFGAPMDLVFSPLEIVSIVLAISITGRLTSDGMCHWMEGALLVGVYALLGIAFFNVTA